MTIHTKPTGFPVGTTLHVLGTLVTLRAGAADTNGALSLVEIRTAPGQGTPPHHHEDAEAFYMLEGAMNFMVGGEMKVLSAGDFAFIPGGTPHAFRNSTGEANRMLGINLPGGPHERFFAEVGEPVDGAATFPPLSPPDVPRLIDAGRRNGVTILPLT